MGYLGNGLTITGTQNSKRIVVDATPNQTISTVTGGYLIGQLDVYRNGVKLVDTQDYTASDGSSVTFLSAASQGDELEFVVFENFDVANALSSSGGTVSGDLVVTGIATFNSDVSIGGTLTYEDVTNVDSVGLITARAGVEIGTPGIAATLTAAGGAVFTGVVTATSFVGDGSGLTGVASTDNINTSTLAQFTGGVGIADSIFHIGDSNTAIRFPAADTFTVTTAGEERGRFTSSNQFVLGPRGSARTNFDNGTVGSNLLHIERQGTGANTGASFLSNTPHADSGAVLYMAKSRSTDNSSATIVSSGDQLGRISFQGADGSNYVEAASIRGHVDGTPGSDDMPGRLSFRTTADGETSATERLRISSTGKHTITGATNGELTIKAGSSSGNDIIAFENSSGTTRGNITYDTDNNFLLFNVNQSERLRITSAGDVGIATDNPTSVFDVQVNTLAGINFTNQGQSPLLDFRANNVESAGRIRVGENGGGAEMLFLTKKTDDTLTEAFRIDTSQRFMIGADSVPTINGIQSRLLVSGDSFANSTYSAVRYEDGANGASIILAHARGTEGSPSTVNSLDEVGKIRFVGHDGTDFAHNFAEIRAHADGTVSGNDCPGRISFFTTEDGGTTSTERLRIGSNGRWGLAGANYGTAGQAIVSNGSGGPPTWQDVASGVSTHVGTASGIVTSIFLGDATDHKVTVTGFVTFTATQAGTEGESHTIRIVNSGIATVGFSTYFLFPSGSAPVLPIADGAVSLISFTVHDSVGAGCTQLLAGASLNFS